VGYVPAFGFSPRLSESLGGCVVGMNLDGQFFFGEEELHQQREAMWVARSRAY
jgi:hypothetical protein